MSGRTVMTNNCMVKPHRKGDMGLVLLEEGSSLFAISRFGHDLQIARALEQLANPGADDVVVIR